MKKFLLGAPPAVTIGLMPNPAPADARQRSQTHKPCLQEAVEDCSGEFVGSHHYTIAIRGWCYIIRSAICDARERK